MTIVQPVRLKGAQPVRPKADPASSGVRWSLDARLMVRPASTYRQLSTQPLQSGAFVALRRPLVLAVALGCVASLITTGITTVRLVVPATLYWAYVPVTQSIALAVVLVALGRRRQLRAALFDVYFAGRSPMLLLQLAIAATLALVNPDLGWTLLTRWGIVAFVLVLSWSTRVDFCFFRDFLRETRMRSVIAVIVLRAIVWPIAFGVFAVPGLTLGDLLDEVAAVIREMAAA